jgi:hypothetical protein
VTPEGRVKAKVKKALDKLGDDCWRFMPVQTGFGTPALDFLLSIRGRFVAIETKAPGKKLTPLQEGTKAAIEAAGGIVLVVWDESSLAIAMKIILAMEFTPRGHTEIRSCLDATFTDEQRESLTAFRCGSPEERVQERLQGAEQPAQAPDTAAGGDHSASGTTPDRPVKPRSRGKDQRASQGGMIPCSEECMEPDYCRSKGKCTWPFQNDWQT